MSFDFETKISAKLINEKTIVINPEMQKILTQRGFGEPENDVLVLDSFETLYLLYNNKLELKKVNKNIIFDELIQKYIQKNDETLIRFLLYRDLRTKGYAVKDGFGCESDYYSIEITEPEPINITDDDGNPDTEVIELSDYNGFNISCYGASNGFIEVTISAVSF